MSRSHTLLIGLLAVGLTGCFMSVSISGSGRLVTQDLDPELRDFDRIEASQAFVVEVRQGSDFSVIIEVDDNVLEHLDVRVVGNTLQLDLIHGSYSLSDVTLRAEVTLPELTGIELSGASQAQLVDMETAAAFEASLSGASWMHGQLRAADADIRLSGASRVELSGGCDKLDLDLSGASSADLIAFGVREVDVEASGASQAKVNASEALSVSASGASNVRYERAPPRLQVHASGVSHVTPLGER